jgi:hypothetical protein
MTTSNDLFATIEKAAEKALTAKAGSAGIQAAMLAAGLGFLLKRIEALEALPFEYAGIHESHKTYRKNQFVTHGGRIWACVVDNTIQQPGTTEDWKLACNKGRDGRDAKDFK